MGVRSKIKIARAKIGNTPTVDFELSEGYIDEDIGLSYGAALLNMNFRGRDETIAAGLIKGRSDQYFLYYFNPWLYGNHISFGFELEKLSYRHHAYEIIDNKIMSIVEPKLNPNDAQLANINGVLNGVKIETDHLQPLILIGEGAGGKATSS